MTPATIAGIPIGDGHPCQVVAEIGTNAAGSLRVAKEMIKTAKDAGCAFVKFQARTPELAVPKAEWNELRDTPWGTMTKLDYRKRVEFSEEEYLKLFAHAKQIGIVAFASVWDLPSLERMERTGSPCHKIPSARLHDFTLIEATTATKKPIILSTGMSTGQDVRNAVNQAWMGWGYKYGLPSGIRDPDWKTDTPGLTILQCTSAYPAKAEESNLRVIRLYRWEFGCPVGFSSHKIGIQTCVLAVAVGANLIERHITFSRNAHGSDHRMSSTKEDLARLVKEIRYTEACLGDGTKKVEASEETEARRLRGSSCTT